MCAENEPITSTAPIKKPISNNKQIDSKLLFAILPATLPIPTLYNFKLKHYVDNKSYLHNIAQNIKAGVRIRVSSRPVRPRPVSMFM